MSKPYDLVAPINTNSGKTIWQKIGTVFKNDNEDKKHLMSIIINTIPLKAFAEGEFQAYVFPHKEEILDNSIKKGMNEIDQYADLVSDDDVPF